MVNKIISVVTNRVVKWANITNTLSLVIKMTIRLVIKMTIKEISMVLDIKSLIIIKQISRIRVTGSN